MEFLEVRSISVFIGENAAHYSNDGEEAYHVLGNDDFEVLNVGYAHLLRASLDLFLTLPEFFNFVSAKEIALSLVLPVFLILIKLHLSIGTLTAIHLSIQF